MHPRGFWVRRIDRDYDDHFRIEYDTITNLGDVGENVDGWV